ncbi:MAG TPA: alpha/beta hydrolase [Bryobacteraceae bacterium]|jgi:monoterpene epsilon-lactone hydrolase|nr:alpha/beta hydrolase [Bryobacteraceae bacterium]
MASLQARVTTWILKRRLKPKLARATEPLEVRRLMRPPPMELPSGVLITQKQIGGVPGEWVEAGVPPGDTLLYLHGGGYVACSAEMHRPITVAFAQHGFRVFAPDYRLAPEHLFPAAVEDAVAVYRSLLQSGIPAGRIAVGGDSAGGGFALAMLMSSRETRLPLPAAVVLFSPWTDLAATGASLVTNDRRCAMFRGANIGPGARFYLGSADPRNPLASPLYGDLSGLPPMLIHAAEDEVLLDDSKRLAERARAAGVRVVLKIWPVVPHDWQLVPSMPEARKSLREASNFLHAEMDG